jgi:aldehyde:ferredoxin oxidoreductase
MEYLSSGKILVVDLGTSETSQEELSEDLVAEKIGGAGITKHLYREHAAGDPVILGTGLLTGTLYPASSLGVMTARSPLTGKPSHAPFSLYTAVELKYSGYDYVVLKGIARHPVFLWVHDGVADIADATEAWGKNTWETTDLWRRSLGDELIQTMVIGPAGESGSPLAQVCLNYWASGDRFGFGKIFGEKNLKGIALRGMGLLEIADPEGFVDRCLEILESIKKGPASGKKGIGEVLCALGEEEAKGWLDPLVHRHKSCYNTPYASNTFVTLDGDPKSLTEPETPEPGFLLTEPYGLLSLKNLGLSAESACRLMRTCARYGIDAVAVGELSAQAGLREVSEIEKAFSSFTGPVTLTGNGTFSPWCPPRPLFADFGLSKDEKAVQVWWERRQALAYLFGIHPLFAVMSPELTEENMIELVRIGTEMEISRDTLESVIADLCE